MVYKLEFVIVTFGIRLHFHNALQSGLLLSHNQRDFIDTYCHIAVLGRFSAVFDIVA